MNVQLLSGSNLKWLAIIAMFIDHFAAIILKNGFIMYAPYQMFSDSQFAVLVGCYEMFHAIGRLAMPIFCFLLVEGFIHTSNKKRYLGRLLAFALLSEIPYDLAFGAGVLDFNQQNVLFTLFLGLLLLTIMQKLGNKALALLLMVFTAVAAYYLNLDGSYYGIVTIFLFYALRQNNLAKCLSVIAWQIAISLFFQEPLLSWSALFAALAVVAVWFYSGKRGGGLKYFFYIFYPAHLLLLTIITKFVIIPFCL